MIAHLWATWFNILRVALKLSKFVGSFQLFLLLLAQNCCSQHPGYTHPSSILRKTHSYPKLNTFHQYSITEIGHMFLDLRLIYQRTASKLLPLLSYHKKIEWWFQLEVMSSSYSAAMITISWIWCVLYSFEEHNWYEHYIIWLTDTIGSQNSQK